MSESAISTPLGEILASLAPQMAKGLQINPAELQQAAHEAVTGKILQGDEVYVLYADVLGFRAQLQTDAAQLEKRLENALTQTNFGILARVPGGFRIHPDGRKASIDVKSLKNTTNWPFTPGHKAHDHFYVLVCYHNKYSDLTTSPEVYVVPSAEIGGLLEEWGGPAHSKQRCVGYPTIRKHPEYKDAWHMLFGPQAG